MNLIVTNTGQEPFAGRFNGEEFKWAPGASLKVSETVARFLFAYGMGETDRARALMRNGWLASSDPDDPFGPVMAQIRLEEFVFKKGPEDPARPIPKAIDLPKRPTEGAAAQAGAA